MRIRYGEHAVAFGDVDGVVREQEAFRTIDEKIFHEAIHSCIFILSQNVAEYGGTDGRRL